MPEKTFGDLYRERELGSFARLIPFLEKHTATSEWREAGQTNYCFFRSQTEGQISGQDLQLSKPLFSRYLELSSPTALLVFSAQLREHLRLTFPGSFTERETIASQQPGQTRTYTVERGTLALGPSNIPVYSLPHPNSQLPGDVRDRAWAFCFS